MDDWGKPLVRYRRCGIEEITVHGAIAWCHGTQVIHGLGADRLIYARSMVKPLQLMGLGPEWAEPRSPALRAFAVSSHNSEPRHLDALRELLPESQLGMLQTPRALPLSRFGAQRYRPRRWYHPCSGAHGAVLGACAERQWSRAGYLLPDHPFHRHFAELCRRAMGRSWQPAALAKDGCGMPTMATTISNWARLFAHWARTDEGNWVWDAMVREPDMVGGFNRLDSTILKSAGGQVVAKEGADGLLGIAARLPAYPEGLGIVLKMAHGWDSQATWYLARAILHALGIPLRNPYPLERQEPAINPDVVPPPDQAAVRALAFTDPWDYCDDTWPGWDDLSRVFFAADSKELG